MRRRCCRAGSARTAPDRALPPVEISPASGVYDHESATPQGPPVSSPPVNCPTTCSIVREGVPVFLESNVAPGLTDTSLMPLALEAAGLGMGEVFSALVERARHRGH